MATTYVQSVERALLILQYLQENKEGLGVTEISHRLDVAKSTTHRLLASLLRNGYVQQDEQTEKYRLGLKLLELGNTITESLDIRKVAQPFLLELSEQTGETAHLVLLEQGEVVYIDKIESSATIGMKSRIGKRAPAYCTGVGKAILCYLTEKRVDQIIDSGRLYQYTKNTITDKNLLKKELSSIRERGYSLDLEEHEEGIRCVGAGILDHHGQVVAGISIAGPSMRMTDQKLEDCAKKIMVCAEGISCHLGYRP
ncbi:MAG TPA: IclR family transcriptional regulator [Bacillales bacterium]|nr:IclR family transcriptional regulator [Bacillales bacterium]